MAKFQITGFSEIEKSLNEIGKFDEYAPDILNGSMEPLLKNLKKRVGAHKKNGALVNSISTSKAKKNKYGWYAAITAKGVDENGTRNAAKLAYLEYGTSHQDAKPVITPAVNESAKEVNEKMQEIFNEKVGELFES